MLKIDSIEVKKENHEERLPGFLEEFPYISTYAQLDNYMSPDIPWHWHRPVELFYMKSGSLEYTTPHRTWTFTEGMGGMVNSNVLHMTRLLPSDGEHIQMLHIFDPLFLAGGHGSRMEKKYILPITANRDIEMILLRPEQREEAAVIELIRKAFTISDQEWGYEFELQKSLACIWLELLKLVHPTKQNVKHTVNDEKIKHLMIYVHEHYQERISVEQLAESVYISKRACFRIFQENLHMSPLEYIHSYRVQRACKMLTGSKETVTVIAQECGFGSSSYFGKIFREKLNCTPEEYRRKMARS